MLARDLEMVEEWAIAPVERAQGRMIPPGIEIEEDSKALARRLELSAIAVEKLQTSAKSFGMVMVIDDISFPEVDLITIDKSRK